MFRRLLIAFGVCSVVACSGQSNVAPSSSTPSGLDARGPSGGVPGVYALSFWASVSRTWQEVSSLPVLSTELILRADVTDLSGNPATAGTVTFEYCSYGGRKNDITDADEAPKEACEQGQARWTRLDTRTVSVPGSCLPLGSGAACYPFGSVRIPRTIGFRFRYAQKGSIASGTSPARNFVWTEALQ